MWSGAPHFPDSGKFAPRVRVLRFPAMFPGWKRASRALRLLLACAVFWLAAGSWGRGAVEQRAVPVMIAPARPRITPAEVPRPASFGPGPRAYERMPAVEPAHAGAELVLIGDRFLRFCSFLS
jgi:hypothetical protein